MLSNFLNSVRNVLMIATACKCSALCSTLKKRGVIEKEVLFNVPMPAHREKILTDIIGRSKHDLSSKEVLELSHLTHGFTGQDLKRLCNEAEEFAWERRNITSSVVPSLNFMDFKESLKHIKPISVAEFNFEIPDVKWADIGGMHDVKNAVTEMIDWPLHLAEQFKHFKIVPCRGILMYGPPGCSKTMIAKALASEGHLNFIPIKGPQIFNKYVGKSEKCVSELFKKARSAAPCVIFFDEIDSISSVRGSTSGNSNVADRVLIQLLIEIDGIDVLQGVSIIAATNRPDIIDPSLLRRFDQLYVPLPDDATRKEILDAKLKKMPLSSDVDLSYLIKATENYSGAEIVELCREAGMSLLKEDITSSTSLVTMKHFHEALTHVLPKT
ncbi:Spermatogenesis-associated protein 5, partial [Stegodyphus mimosarum]